MTDNIPAESLRKTIAYYYLVAYCPPENVAELKEAAGPLRKGVAKQAGLKLTAYFKEAVPRVCRHIVGFHQNSREPDDAIVEALADKARGADAGAKKAAAFQEEMARVAVLPGRARAENRLHHRRGCRLCAAPCQCGYFTLVSDPAFPVLQAMLQRETERPEGERNLLRAVWTFAMEHLAHTLGVWQGYVTANHLGNLAYCLLTLATAKSRLPFPEAQMAALQEANQEMIQGWQTTRIG